MIIHDYIEDDVYSSIIRSFLITIYGLPDGETSFWLLFILLQPDPVIQPSMKNVVCNMTKQTIP